MRYQASLAIAATTMALAAASPVEAHAASSRFILRGDMMAPPTGFVAMCRTDPTFCQDDAAEKPSPAPAWEGRVATGLPAITMAVTNMIAAILPDMVAKLDRPATSDRKPHKPSLSVVPTVALVPSGVTPRATTTATTPGEISARPTPSSIFTIAMPDALAATGTMPADAIAPPQDLWSWKPLPPVELATITAEPDPATTTIAITAPARGQPATDTERASAKLLDSVNKLVNGRVIQRPDMQIYATAEHWARSGIAKNAQGDCEDLAIEKRYQLIAQGFDAKRLSFAVVFSPQTKLHTVLVARTADGDMVLDSDTPWIRRVDQTDYSWISIQSPENGMRWQTARL